MCTVTYIPTSNKEFIFTSNRDEAPKRSATEMAREIRGTREILFPRDALAKGTWICLSNQNQLVCILNGAFEKHKHRPPYRLSRGIMALDFFSYPDARTFFDQFAFEGIEPFTMVIYDDGDLWELRWDESQKHILQLDTTQPHLWASCTLYPEEWQLKRQSWFKNWQNGNEEISQQSVLDFHKNAGEGNPEYDVVMNRNNIVRTTSVTSILRSADEMTIRYEDILEGVVEEAVLKHAK